MSTQNKETLKLVINKLKNYINNNPSGSILKSTSGTYTGDASPSNGEKTFTVDFKPVFAYITSIPSSYLYFINASSGLATTIKVAPLFGTHTVTQGTSLVSDNSMTISVASVNVKGDVYYYTILGY